MTSILISVVPRTTKRINLLKSISIPSSSISTSRSFNSSARSNLPLLSSSKTTRRSNFLSIRSKFLLSSSTASIAGSRNYTWSTFVPHGSKKEGLIAATTPAVVVGTKPEAATQESSSSLSAVDLANSSIPPPDLFIPDDLIPDDLTSSLPIDPASEFLNTITTSSGTIINTGTLELASLAGSWGPHPIMRLQSLFLQLHESFPFLYHGLPWFILIPTVTVFLRFLLFGFQVRAQANAARMAIIQPQMLKGMEKLKAAKARKDSMGAQTAQMETQALMREHNVNPIRNLAFPLAQATVFMTMFFALRGLVSSGIPSFSQEGLWWFSNLAMADPYWALPVASTALTLATLELGVDATTQVQTSTTKNMKLFFRAMLVVALPFISYFPAGVLLYWVTNNSISLIQSLALKQTPVRKFFNIPTIPPKIQPGELGYVPEPSFLEAFRNVQVGVSEKWEQQQEEASKKAELKATMQAPQRAERVEVYRPRAPIRRRVGAVEKIANGGFLSGGGTEGGEGGGMLEMEPIVRSNVTNEIKVEGKKGGNNNNNNNNNNSRSSKVMSKEEEKVRRVMLARIKKNKA